MAHAGKNKSYPVADLRTPPQIMFLLLLLISSQPVASNNTSQCFGVICQGFVIPFNQDQPLLSTVNPSLFDFFPEPGYSYFKPSKSGKGVDLGYTITVEEIFKVRL